jgi:predicted esterase
VCAISAILATALGFQPNREAIAGTRPDPVPAQPETLVDAMGAPSAVVYAPAQTKPEARAITVMLHGMCDEPQWECPYFANATTPGGWLVCPRANVRCDGGGSTWSFDGRFSAAVESSVQRVKNEHPEEVDDTQGRTLIGFSLGALRAMDLAHEGGGKYPYVILIGAKVYPNAKKLRAAGVQRIVLAAGEHDMMKAHMLAQAKKLARQGFPAVFMSLGKVGHTFPKDMDARVARATAWLHGDDAALD